MSRAGSAAIGIALFSAGALPALAQGGWDSRDAWRAQYKVGDQVQLSISGSASDYQTCVVTENDPADLMRARCEAFKYWVAGV